MTDAEYEAERQRLLALSEKWINPLGLGWWDIDLAYARDDYSPPGGTKNGVLAHCDVDWRYGHATITWNMPELLAYPDEKLERAFVHELMHIFLNEMRWTASNDEDSIDHEERVATTLTKAFLWQRDSLDKVVG